jgi:hypothetical protein
MGIGRSFLEEGKQMTSEERRLSDLFKSNNIENKCTICQKDAPALFRMVMKSRNAESEQWYLSDECACGQCAYDELHAAMEK